MERHADAAADDAPQRADVSIPTAGRTVTRTLPACAAAVVGMPLLAWFLPRDPGQRAPWELLTVLAALGLSVIVHRLTRAPRPRFDEEVGRAQWKRAFASVARSRFLPPHPAVRTAAGVVACNNVEGLMMAAAVLLGTLCGELVRPELSWMVPAGGVLGAAIGYAFRLRRSWLYLSVLHAGGD